MMGADMPRKSSELNALAVSRLTEPGLYFVGGVPGLALQVAPSGARSWVLRMTVGTKRRDMGLGSYSPNGMTLARARVDGLAARAKVKAGIDPIEEGRAARSLLKAAQAAALTFDQCTTQYLAAHESAWKSTIHKRQWRNTLEQYASPVMGSLLVRDVGLPHVLKVLEPIWTTKTETASRLRGRIEAVLDWAKGRGYRTGDNPAAWKGNLQAQLPRPDKVATVKHHEAVAVVDVGAFMVKLRAAEGMGARALEFVILTAARSGEARGATWAEIDTEEKVWTVPGARMKAGKEHRVPLSDAALSLLKALPRMVGSDLVFAAPRSGLLSDMTLTAVMRRMGLEAVPHGFRSTFRDWASERTAYPREACEMALAHTIGDKVEAAYRRGDLFDKRRRMMTEWAAFLGNVETKGAVVVPMRGTA